MGDIRNPYIIAEIGFNHEGDMALAVKMIRAAARAGADAVKFQTYRAGDLALPSSPHFNAIRCGEMDLDQHLRLAGAAKNNKVDFISTPYSKWAVDLLEKVGVKAYKIASMDLTNSELLKHVADTGKPVFVSTGMANIEEIASAANRLKRFKSGPVTMLHCLSKYPAEPKDITLSFMGVMRERCRCRVGYSDHMKGTLACLAAAIMGAEVIEKHFTLDRSRPGADHYHSADEAQLKKMVEDINAALSIIGVAGDIPKRTDREDAALYRRGVYARVDIPKGAVIARDELVCCRPASEFGPSDLARIIDRRARFDIRANSPITNRNVDV